MIKKYFSQKIGMIIGLIISCLLLSYYYFPFLERPTWHNILPPFKQLIAISFLIIIGMISGFIIQHYFIIRYSKIGQKWGGIIGSILIAPCALILGLFFAPVGSIFGRFGVIVAIAIIIIIVECIGTIIGSLFGSLIQKMIQRYFRQL